MTAPTKAINVNGLNLQLRDAGSGSPTLVFLHYWGGSGRTWDLVTSELSRHHRCVAPDLRGWGGSGKPAEGYGLEIQADDVVALVDALDLPDYVLIGHSMGGKIAQIIGGRRPSGLQGLILVAPAPPTPMAVPAEQRRMMLESYQTREGVEAALRILAEKPLSLTLREQVIEDTLGGAPAAKRAWTERGMTLDITASADRIDVPTVVIVGDSDRVENETVLARELVRRVRGARVVTLPGVGHLSPLEAPTALGVAISNAVHEVCGKTLVRN